MEFLQPSVQSSGSQPGIESLSHASASTSAPRSPARSDNSVSANFTSNPPNGYRAPPPTLYGVIPRPGHPRDDMLRDRKQHMIDRFRHFHLGCNSLMFYDSEKRGDIIRRIPIPPNQGSWPGHPRAPPTRRLWPITNQNQSRNRRPGRLRRLLPWVRDNAVDDDDDDPQLAADERAADRWAGILRRDFRPARFRFRRRLGFGAFGAAFLFEMRDEGGEVLPVVVKVAISGSMTGLAREKENFVVSHACSRVQVLEREAPIWGFNWLAD